MFMAEFFSNCFHDPADISPLPPSLFCIKGSFKFRFIAIICYMYTFCLTFAKLTNSCICWNDMNLFDDNNMQFTRQVKPNEWSDRHQPSVFCAILREVTRYTR